MPDFRVTYEETELREVIVTADTADDARRMVGDFEVSLMNSELIETVSTNVVNVEPWSAGWAPPDDDRCAEFDFWQTRCIHQRGHFDDCEFEND